jgi:hypothetical protein
MEQNIELAGGENDTMLGKKKGKKKKKKGKK